MDWPFIININRLQDWIRERNCLGLEVLVGGIGLEDDSISPSDRRVRFGRDSCDSEFRFPGDGGISSENPDRVLMRGLGFKPVSGWIGI